MFYPETCPILTAARIVADYSRPTLDCDSFCALYNTDTHQCAIADIAESLITISSRLEIMSGAADQSCVIDQSSSEETHVN